MGWSRASPKGHLEGTTWSSRGWPRSGIRKKQLWHCGKRIGTRTGQSREGAKPTPVGPRRGLGGHEHRKTKRRSASRTEGVTAEQPPGLTDPQRLCLEPLAATSAFQSRGRHVSCGHVLWAGPSDESSGELLTASWKRCWGSERPQSSPCPMPSRRFDLGWPRIWTWVQLAGAWSPAQGGDAGLLPESPSLDVLSCNMARTLTAG